VRIRVLRWFARSGLIGPDAVHEMLAWVISGFSLNAAVHGAGTIVPSPSHIVRSGWPLGVRFVGASGGSQPNTRCLSLADSGPSPADAERQLTRTVRTPGMVTRRGRNRPKPEIRGRPID
jgi:hypothetical protein